MKTLGALLLGAALTVTAGCGDGFAVPDSASVPANPTWENSVRRIMNGHCVNCHGAEPNRGSPRDFRLDSYAGTPAVPGARDMAGEIVESVQEGEMPEEQPLGPNDTKILARWFANGAPEK